MKTAVLLFLVCFQMQQPTGLDEALEAQAQGRLPKRVPIAIGLEAVEELQEADGAKKLRALAEVARAARADRPLAEALVKLIVSGVALRREAIKILAELRPRTVRRATAAVSASRWVDALAELADDERPETALPALDLLVPRASAATIAESVHRWDKPGRRDRAVRVLELVLRAETTDPQLFGELVVIEVSPDLDGALGEALTRLVTQDEKAARAAIDRVRLRQSPWVHAMRSLGGIVPEGKAWDESRELLATVLKDLTEVALEEGEERQLVCAIQASSELFLSELFERLPKLVKHERPAVRASAAEAYDRVGARDRATLQLLLAMLGDESPQVQRAAHRSLMGLSGIKLPLRPEAWDMWLSGQTKKIQFRVKGDPDIRLGRQRSIVAAQRAAERERMQKKRSRAGKAKTPKKKTSKKKTPKKKTPKKKTPKKKTSKKKTPKKATQEKTEPGPEKP